MKPSDIINRKSEEIKRTYWGLIKHECDIRAIKEYLDEEHEKKQS